MNLRKLFTMGLVAMLLVGAIAFALPGGSVAAQAPTPQPKDPQAKTQQAGFRLEKAFAAEQKLLEKQAQHFDRADAIIAKTEALVAKAKANGKDTTAIEAALAQLKTKEADARKLHDDAAVILATHSGFDANGKVIDAGAAKVTVQSAKEPLKEVHTFFSDALKATRDALKEWRQNHPKPTK